MRRLRVPLLIFAVVLFTFAVVSSPTLPMRASLLVGNAAIGLSAAVPSNPYNALAQELLEREAELDRREAMLRDAESANAFSRLSAAAAPYSFAASLALFFLVALNYFLDWRRGRTRRGYASSA